MIAVAKKAKIANAIAAKSVHAKIAAAARKHFGQRFLRKNATAQNPLQQNK